MRSPSWRRPRASLFSGPRRSFLKSRPIRLLVFAGATLAGLGASAADLAGQSLAGTDYDLAREALVEAIEAEGLIPGPTSHFGEMLRRTDADLGHGGDIYSHADVFSFCSVAVAARLVREDPDRIADCPLTVALYRLKAGGEVRLVYRRRDGDTPASLAANRLLERIAERTVKSLPAASKR